MLERIIVFVIGLSIIGTANAQQEYQFANFANNPYYLNPAAAGLTDVMQIEISGRTQWMGYSGAPTTMMVSGHSQIRSGGKSQVLAEFNPDGGAFFEMPEVTTGKIKHVLGGRMLNDVIGPFSKTSAYGSYAVHLPFFKDVNFGAGIGAGWSNFKVDESRVILHQDDDMAYAQFLGGSSTQNFVDANAGLVFYNNLFVAGISTTQLLNNNVVFNETETGSNYNRHFFLTGRYNYEVSSSFTLQPTAVVKYVKNSPLSIDLGARFLFNNAAWLSLQYRTSNAVVFQVGTNLIKNLYISYGFEQATGRISSGTNSTHELQLGMYIGNNRNIKKEVKGSDDSKARTD